MQENIDLLTNMSGITSLNSILERNNVEVEEEPNLISHSPYFTNEMFVQTVQHKNNIFKCICMNIQSINAKIEQLRIYLDSLEQNNIKIDAIMLQETWIAENTDISLLHIDGFNMISQPYQVTSHGGLIIYLHDEIEYETISIDKSPSGIWEGLFLKVKLQENKYLTIGNIYRPPRNLANNYTAFKEELVLVLNQLDGNVVIGGDFNIDLLKISEKPVISEYFDAVVSCGYIPKISLPTRLSRNGGTLIDNFLCKISNDFSNCTSGVLTYNISDHLPIFVCLDFLSDKVKNVKFVRITKKSERSTEQLCDFIDNEMIMSKLNCSVNADPNSNYEILNSILKTAIDTCMPTKLVKYNKHRHKKSRWISSGLIKSISFRDKLYQKLKSTSADLPLYDQLKHNLSTYNRILRKAIREAKRIYYHTCFEKYKSNMKKTWLTINEIINKSNRNSNVPDHLIINDSKVTDKKIIAEEFNKFFVNIGPQLSSNIISSDIGSFKDYLLYPSRHTFEFNPVSVEEVSKVIDKLHSKPSAGFDRMSTTLLKKIKPNILQPVTLIINQILTNGIFPDKLKIARVKPLYKKNDPNIIDNYRPISVLPAISKIIEKIMFKQIHEYFNTNKLYYSNQYGFRESHSTEHAQLELIDRIIWELDNGKTPINIYMDLSKAFDTIDHSILLQKMSFYGFSENSLDLVHSYLSNRVQYVDLDGVISSSRPLKTGVPQGSILGPLLFILYVNDMSCASDVFHFISYADDTTICVNISTNSDINERETVLNNELQKVYHWLQLNKLSLNVGKTKCMAFHMQQKNINKPSLKINDCPIEYVDNFNFLGIILDKHLNWKSHVDNLSKKMSKTIGIMTRLKRYLPIKTLKIMYDSLIASHLNYGILCWGFKCQKVVQLQKIAIRVITCSKYNAHTKPLFKKLELLTVDDMRKRKMLKLFFKFSHQKLPNFFMDDNLLIRQTATHSYDTRNSNYKLPRTKHNFAKNCLRYNLPSLLNETPLILLDKVNTHSELGFSLYTKKHYISNYNAHCDVVNCYICTNN